MSDLPKEAPSEKAAREIVDLLRKRWKVRSASNDDYDCVRPIIKGAILEVLTGDDLLEFLSDDTVLDALSILNKASEK